MDLLKYKPPFKTEGWTIVDSERKVVEKDDILELMNSVHTSEQGFEEWNNNNPFVIDIIKSRDSIEERVALERKKGWLASNNGRKELAREIYSKLGLTPREDGLDHQNILEICEYEMDKD